MTNEQRVALRALIKDSWQTAEDKGWHQDEELYREVQSYVDEHALDKGHEASMWKRILKRLGSESYGVQVMEKICLIVSEAMEAAEGFRDAGTDLRALYWVDSSGAKHALSIADAKAGLKPEGLSSEFADVIIRVCDLSHSLGLDLVTALEAKAEFNRTRSFRHGSKRA